MLFFLAETALSQVVKNRIGTNGSTHQMLRIGNDTLVFFGDFNAFGKPLMGLELFDLDSGVHQKRATSFAGTAIGIAFDSVLNYNYVLGDLGYIMALENSANLIRVNSNGEVDDQFVFQFADFKDFKSKFKSVTKLGDTLYCTGSFGKVNNVEVDGIVGINCKTLQVFKIDVKPCDYNFVAKALSQQLCLFNKLLTVNGQTYANFVTLDRKSLKPITAFNTPITSQPLTVTEDNNNIYVQGKNELNGWSAGNLDVVSKDFQKHNLPTGWFDPSSSIQKVISDGNGGYFISGDFKTYNYQKVDRLVHLDSNGVLDTLFKYISEISPKDIVRIGDTIVMIYQSEVELKSGAGYGSFWLYNLQSNKFIKSSITIYAGTYYPALNSWKNKLIIRNVTVVNGMANFGPVIVDLKTNTLEYVPFYRSVIFDVNEDLDEIVTPQAGIWPFGGYKVSGYVELDYSDPIPKKFKTEINGQVEVMEPDGKGGYYMSGQSIIGRFRSSSTASEIFHILPNGTLDQNFRFEHDGYGAKNLKLIGDKLFASGSIKKENPYVRDWVVVDAISGDYLYTPTTELRNGSCLEKLSDSTILIAGSFWDGSDSTKQYMTVYDAKNLKILPWSSGLTGGGVAATELTDSFLYVFGSFTEHRSKPISNLIRFKRFPILHLDTSWNISASGKFVDAKGLDVIDSILYVRGGCYKSSNCRINGFQWTNHAAINLKTFTVDTLNINLDGSIYALEKFNDSLLLGGGPVSGTSTLLSYDLVNKKVNNWNPRLNSFVKQIIVSGDTILVAHGDGSILSEQGEFARFDMNSRRLIPTKTVDYNVIKYGNFVDFETSEKYLFTVKDEKFVYQNDTFYGLTKFDLLGTPLKWNPEISQLQKVEGILNFDGNLVVFGPSAFSNQNDEYYVISLDFETGKRNKPLLHYQGKVFNLFDVNGKLAVIGDMGIRLGTKTLSTKWAKKSASADTNYVLDFDQLLAVEKNSDGHIIGVLEPDSTAHIYQIDDGGKTRLVASLYNNDVPQIFSILQHDSTVYFSANAQMAISASDTLNMDGNGLYNINTFLLKFGGENNTTSAPIKIHKQLNNNCLITSTSVQNLLNPVKNQTVAFFDKSSGAYGPLGENVQVNNLYSSLGNRGATYLDNLIVANCLVIDANKDSSTKLSMINIKSGINIDAMPVFPPNSGIYDIEVIGDTLFVAGSFNGNLASGEKVTYLFGWSISQKKVIWNPVIDAVVHEIHFDSLFHELIFSGQFTRVKGENRRFISSINVQNLQLKSQTKWADVNQYVYEINVSGAYIILAGSGINFKNQGVILIDRASEKVNELEDVPSQVLSGTVIENYLLLSTQTRVHVIDLSTGLPSTFMGDIGMVNYRMDVIDSTLWTIGIKRNQTYISSGYISEITLDEGLTNPAITRVEPNTIAVIRESSIEVFGYQLDRFKTMHLANNHDTLQPITGSTKISKNGRRLTARFALDAADTGFYQVLLKMQDSTNIISKDTLHTELPEFGYSQCTVVGPDSIRSNEAYIYQFKVVNHSNFDRYFTPIAVLSSAKSNLKFIGLGFDTTLYSYKESVVVPTWGSSKNLNLQSMVIPKLASGESFSFYAKIKPQGNDAVYLDFVAQTPIHFFDSSSRVNLISAFDKLVPGIDTIKSADSLVKKVEGIKSIYQPNPLIKQDLIPFNYFLKNWLENTGGDITDLDKNLLKSFSNDTNFFGDFMGSPENLLANSPWQVFKIFNPQPVKIEVINSYDPNKKIGTKGFAGSTFTDELPSQIPFVIHFENDSSATAPLQYLKISDTINIDIFNPLSIRFSNIMIGDVMLEIESNSNTIDRLFDLRNEFNIYLSVKTNYNPSSHILTWQFWALDPTSFSKNGLGATQGFLSPHKAGKNGRGFVSFQIDVKPNSEKLRNKASIIFDKNEPIMTNNWQLSLDKTPPISRVIQSRILKTSKSFEVKWSGSDDGIGIEYFDVYVSTDSKNYDLWLKETTNTNAIFTAKTSGPHFFYSIATDKINNREIKQIIDAEYFITEDSDDNILVYPNPTTEKWVKVITDFQGEITLEVYGSTGNLIRTSTGSANEVQIIEFITPGLYFIVVQNSAGQKFTKKVMVL